jgi:fatty-acyl-CoA synthase
MAAYINRWKVTHCVIVPSLFRPLLDEDDKQPLGLESLRWVLTGGENCPPALMNAFRERWPHVWLTIAYGSTESGYATFIEDADIPRHPASVGRPAPGQSVLVASPDGEPLPPGRVGEVWTAGPSVISQYWDAPELNAETMREGWLKMGDLGRFDDDGYLYIEGRSKDLIISKGHNIYPAEIEAVLKAMPELADVTVLGVPDPEFGEAVCAVAVRAPGSSVGADEIVDYVRGRMASYKKPKHVLFHESLPRNATGKVVKHELRERCLRECLRELGVLA